MGVTPLYITDMFNDFNFKNLKLALYAVQNINYPSYLLYFVPVQATNRYIAREDEHF